VALLVVAAWCAPGAVAASAKKPTSCKSGDLRYPFMPGGPKDFGVFKLTITGGSCSTAHSVAKAWQKRFEASIRSGRLNVPKSVSGFSFTTLPATEAQQYRERGRKGATTIRFDYRVPNG
jgi:hypothetical protein